MCLFSFISVTDTAAGLRTVTLEFIDLILPTNHLTLTIRLEVGTDYLVMRGCSAPLLSLLNSDKAMSGWLLRKYNYYYYNVLCQCLVGYSSVSG